MFDYDVKCVYCFSKIDFRKILFEKKEILPKLEEVYPDQPGEESRHGDKISLDKISSAESGRITSQGMNSKKKQSSNKLESSVSSGTGLICFENCIDENLKIKGFKADGKEYTGSISKEDYKSLKKFCPHCRKLLISDVGDIEIINIGMVGHPKAGKTVYLTIQDYCIFHGNEAFKQTLKVPNGFLVIDNEFSHLPDGESEDTIYQTSEKFRQEQTFPIATGSMPTPYCLRIGYRSNDNNTQNLSKCIVCYRDIVGEGFKDISQAQEAKEYLKKSDALLILTDPEAFSMQLPIGNNLEFDSQNAKMQKNVNIFFGNNGAVTVPSVCMLSKEDIFVNYIGQEKTKLEKIKVNDPVVAEGMKMEYKENEDMAEKFRQLSESTKECINDIVMGSFWGTMMQSHFINSVYIPVSSIGKKCTVHVKDRRYLVENNSSIQAYIDENFDDAKDKDAFMKEFTLPALALLEPRFIVLPLMYFLEQFGIIPPIYEKESYKSEVRRDKHGSKCFWKWTDFIHTEFDEDVYREWTERWKYT